MFSSSLLLKDCSSGQLSLCLAATDGFFFMSLSYHLFLKPCKFVPSEGIMKGFLQGYQTVDAKTHSLLPSQLVGICRAMCVCVWSLLGMSNLFGLEKVVQIFLSFILYALCQSGLNYWVKRACG